MHSHMYTYRYAHTHTHTHTRTHTHTHTRTLNVVTACPAFPNPHRDTSCPVKGILSNQFTSLEFKLSWIAPRRVNSRAQWQRPEARVLWYQHRLQQLYGMYPIVEHGPWFCLIFTIKSKLTLATLLDKRVSKHERTYTQTHLHTRTHTQPLLTN